MDYDFYVYAVALSHLFAYKCNVARGLVNFAGGPEKVFELSRRELEELLNGPSPFVDGIRDGATLEWARREVEWDIANGVTPIYISEGRYPYRLRECPDAPLVLFCRGNADLNPRQALAVVGTRRCTYCGRTSCTSIVGDLAKCVTPPVIISGLAYGIDAAAHTAALDAGLQTIAVSPVGADTIYPLQHRRLAERIIENGAVVTDFCRNTAPVALTFVRRNRIIAGMADATLLVESFAKGGGLITARHASSYDREVFALPGRTTDPSFQGCNSLIEQDIAHIATGATSITTVMGWIPPTLWEPQRTAISEREYDGNCKKVLSMLRRRSPMDLETMSGISGIGVRELSIAVLQLEFDGAIVNCIGNMYELA